MIFNALYSVYDFLKFKYEKKPNIKMKYLIPSTWISLKDMDIDLSIERNIYNINVENPYGFFATRIKEIIDNADIYKDNPDFKDSDISEGKWTNFSVVYNLFPRVATSYDHNGDGIIGSDWEEDDDLTLNSDGFRETGTLLKCILLLPLLKKMGINTIHLLPITKVGKYGKKGELGSVYAIKNPYKTDELLHDPLLNGSDIDVDNQLQAFTEAAKALGFKLVFEFILRTASIDSDWIKENPEWFFWQKVGSEFRIPELYNKDVLYNVIDKDGNLQETKKFSNKNEWLEWFDNYNGFKGYIKSLKYELKNLIKISETDPEYLKRFTDPPCSSDVKLKKGKYIGKVGEDKVEIVPGFADDPFDFQQPPWQDVTFLKLYRNPKNEDKSEYSFNHLGYDTAKYLHVNPEQEEKYLKKFRNESLWEKIKGIIPYYQERYGIDGVMLDMGHALPLPIKEDIMKQARIKNKNFAFWDENLDGITLYKGFSQGYNALNGNLFCFLDNYKIELFNFIKSTEKNIFSGKMFGTPESHNTKRSATFVSQYKYKIFNRMLYSLFNFIPFLIPYIHNGFELLETNPINTGLGFTVSESSKFFDNMDNKKRLDHKNAPKLGLFSRASFNWLNPDNLIEDIAYLSNIRKDQRIVKFMNSNVSILLNDTKNKEILSFTLENELKEKLFIAVNLDMYNNQTFHANIEPKVYYLRPLKVNNLENNIEFVLNPGKVMVCFY